MGSVSGPRWCAREEKCVGYDPEKGRPAKLARDNQDVVCSPCRKRESDDNFGGFQCAPSIEYKTIKAWEYPLKAELTVLKRNLVAQMLGMPGRFREAVEEVRARWRIDDPPTLLPPPYQERSFLEPPGLDEQADLKKLHETLCSQHPHLIPIARVQGARPTDRSTYYDNLAMRWEYDLKHVLFLGGVPQAHIYGEGGRLLLPWLRFAAACVLYRPPVEEAPTFAEYGGLPTLPGEEAEGEPILGVQTERQRIESQKYANVKKAAEKFINEKMWENRRDLPGDYRKAHFEVMERHLVDLMELQDRVLKKFEQYMEDNPPPHHYYIKYIPEEDKDRDVSMRLRAIRKQEGHASKSNSDTPGAPEQPDPSRSASPKAARGDHLLPVMCALLLKRPGLTREWLAQELGLSVERVGQIERAGQELLGA